MVRPAPAAPVFADSASSPGGSPPGTSSPRPRETRFLHVEKTDLIDLAYDTFHRLLRKAITPRAAARLTHQATL